MLPSGRMRRRWIIGAALIAAVTASTASATGVPHIVSASSSHRHLVVRAQFGDLLPATVSVATKPARVRGELARANVVYSTRLDLKASSGTLRWRSPARLPRGTYWLQVSAVEADGVPDCPPQLHNCTTHYSNVVRVTMRK